MNANRRARRALAAGRGYRAAWLMTEQYRRRHMPLRPMTQGRDLVGCHPYPRSM